MLHFHLLWSRSDSVNILRSCFLITRECKSHFHRVCDSLHNLTIIALQRVLGKAMFSKKLVENHRCSTAEILNRATG